MQRALRGRRALTDLVDGGFGFRLGSGGTLGSLNLMPCKGETMNNTTDAEVKISPHDPQRGVGDNGGPQIKKLTAKGKVERIKEVLDMDISAAQKCIGIRIIADADADGITPELSTDDLKRAASVKDRKTVYTATQRLEGKKVAKPVREDGRPNRYLVLQDEVIDAIIDEIDASTSAVERQCQQTAVPTDGSAVEHQYQQTAPVPVPLNGTTPPAPVPFNGTTPVPSDGTSAVERHGTSAVERHIRERESNTERERERERAKPPVVEVNGSAIYGPGFTLDFGAIDMAAGLSGVPVERARQIAEICARDWAANGTKPASPMAMVKRAIASDRNHKQTDDARAAAAAKNTPANKRERIAQWAREEEDRLKAEKSKWSARP
jgi:hypothetical protein